MADISVTSRGKQKDRCGRGNEHLHLIAPKNRLQYVLKYPNKHCRHEFGQLTGYIQMTKWKKKKKKLINIFSARVTSVTWLLIDSTQNTWLSRLAGCQTALYLPYRCTTYNMKQSFAPYLVHFMSKWSRLACSPYVAIVTAGLANASEGCGGTKGRVCKFWWFKVYFSHYKFIYFSLYLRMKGWLLSNSCFCFV